MARPLSHEPQLQEKHRQFCRRQRSTTTVRNRQCATIAATTTRRVMNHWSSIIGMIVIGLICPSFRPQSSSCHFFVQGAPYILLTNGEEAKCFHVDVSRDTAIEINYTAPDMVMRVPQPVEGQPQGGAETQAASDTTILVSQKTRAGGHLSRLTLISNRVGGSGRIEHQVKTTDGKFEYITGNMDGYVEICIQARDAKLEAPSRVSVRVINKEIEQFNGVSATIRELANEKREEEVQKLTTHSSRITSELASFEQRIRELDTNAKYSKDREAEFHGKSVSLNKAVKYWPMFRIIILVVAGYIQGTHVVSYMKSRHIF